MRPAPMTGRVNPMDLPARKCRRCRARLSPGDRDSVLCGSCDGVARAVTAGVALLLMDSAGASERWLGVVLARVVDVYT